MRAQQSGKVYRLGQLSGGTATSRVPLLAAFMGGMRELGYAEGRNLIIEHRYADGRFERLPALARELVEWNPDVLFVSTTPASLAAKAATSTVPIVMVSVADPQGVGLITNLSRPGANITGLTDFGSESPASGCRYLRRSFHRTRVAVLINPKDENAPFRCPARELAADKHAVQLAPVMHVRSGQTQGRN